MSRKSQSTLRRLRVDPSVPPPVNYDCPRAIVACALNFEAAFQTPPHSHPRGELLYAEHGTLTTTAVEGNWVAPPDRAIWIPVGVMHVTRHTVNTEVRAIFVRRDVVPRLPARCAVIQVNPLLRALILAAVQLPALYDEDGADGRLVQVLLDRLAVLPDEPLHLPMPGNKKLRTIAAELAAHPDASLKQVAHQAAMSPRSFARNFVAETGLTFGAWQRQARLLRALELLGTGLNVGDVAFALGYQSTSAFIAMFRRSFGTTPNRYFEGIR